MLNEWEKWKQSLGETRPWHMLDPNAKIPDKKYVKARLDICESCPQFIKLTSQCKECGCVMKLKTHLVHAECPIGKWSKWNIE
jgi:hypothetical protein